MERITGEGITQDKVERQIWENFTSTFSKQNDIQAQKIKKLKQYYLGINSSLRLTWPIYFIAFIVNSSPNFPLISTPPRLQIVCSALLWSPSHMLRCRSLGVGTTSAASFSPSTCKWAHCTNQQAAFPGGCLHGLLGQGACFPADQRKSKPLLTAPLLFIAAWELSRDAFPRRGPCPEGLGMLHQLIGARVVTAVPVCNKAISQKANQALFLSLSLRYTSTNFSWLKGSGSEPLAQAALQLGERFRHLQSAVHLALPKTGVSCRKDQSFFRGTHFPPFIGEGAWTTCLDYVSTHLGKLREESHLLGLMLQLY